MTTINIRTDEEIKKEAESLFNELGLNMSTAINIFLKKAISEKGIPFDVKLEVPNKVTMQALKEGEKLINDGSKGYTDIKSLRGALDV